MRFTLILILFVRLKCITITQDMYSVGQKIFPSVKLQLNWDSKTSFKIVKRTDFIFKNYIKNLFTITFNNRPTTSFVEFTRLNPEILSHSSTIKRLNLTRFWSSPFCISFDYAP